MISWGQLDLVVDNKIIFNEHSVNGDLREIGPYMSTLRHSYGVSVILASLKTSVPETKISVVWRSPRYLKNCGYLLQSMVKTQPHFRAFLTVCLSAGARRYKVGDNCVPGGNAWLGISYSFTRARSRTTFHDMMTRTSMSDVSETDVSPMNLKIQKKPHRYFTKLDKIARSCKGGRYALTARCQLFRSDGWRCCRGEGHPFEIAYLGRHEDLCT